MKKGCDPVSRKISKESGVKNEKFEVKDFVPCKLMMELESMVSSFVKINSSARDQ